MSYQGFSNWQTAKVNDWISDTPESYSDMRQLCRSHDCAAHAATCLKQVILDEMPDLPNEMWDELLLGGLTEVNWLELAETLIQDS